MNEEKIEIVGIIVLFLREVLNLNMWCIKIFIKNLFFWLIIVLKNCFIKFNLFLNLFIENLNF